MKHILIILTLLGSMFVANAQQKDTIEILNVAEFQNAIKDKSVQLIDVRTAEEFKDGAIRNAQNIDFFQEENFKTEFGKLDKDQPVYLYCRSGNRSHQAATKLKAMGFTKIYDLKGGYLAWPFKD